MVTNIENVVPADILNQLKKPPLIYHIILASGLLANPNFLNGRKENNDFEAIYEILNSPFNEVFSENDCNCLFQSVPHNTTVENTLQKMNESTKYFALIRVGNKYKGFCTRLILSSVDTSESSEPVKKHSIDLGNLTSCKNTDRIFDICTTLAQDDIEYILIVADNDEPVCIVSAQIMINKLFGTT